ncbi:MAG TPA: pilus assembly protein PilP [Burkholderiales bacterium]|nr:pilus assembly protein PilP [Burkholderiales bacterium]
MMRFLLTIAMAALLLSGCGGEQFSDLKDFVKNSGNDLRGRVEPIPEVRQFEPFAYNAFDLPDPFKPRKTVADTRTGTAGGGGPRPDLNRRKEALEAFPLESLQMVGTLEQKQVRYALIKTPDANLYRVKSGNYLGQNFGVVTSISESTVTLKEVIQDSSSGSWTERTSSLQLLEQ